MKIINKNIITIHDDLLYHLYDLGIYTIKYSCINGEKYLINSYKGKGYEIGLRKKITDKEVEGLKEDIPLYEQITKNSNDLREIIIDFDNQNKINYKVRTLISNHYQDLCLSNIEKYVFNILFDKYLGNEYEFDISFSEIEYKYRGKGGSRKLTVDKAVAIKYASAIDKLSKKEIFLKTKDYFRDKRYGVGNINLSHPLLKINNKALINKNNICFNYSLGGFGVVIRKSKRYSTILSSSLYRINFNKLRKYLVGFYLARAVYIQQGLIEKNPSTDRFNRFDIDIDDYIYLTRDVSSKERKENLMRERRQIINYIKSVIDHIDYVADLEERYIYDETEHFMKKHEFDYDVINDLDNYEFTPKDLDEDVSLTLTVIMDIF